MKQEEQPSALGHVLSSSCLSSAQHHRVFSHSVVLPSQCYTLPAKLGTSKDFSHSHKSRACFRSQHRFSLLPPASYWHMETQQLSTSGFLGSFTLLSVLSSSRTSLLIPSYLSRAADVPAPSPLHEYLLRGA